MKADDPRHGTRAGYQAHRKVKQQACRPCLDAASADNRQRLWGEDDVALTGGSWRPQGLIQRWVSEMAS